MSTTRYPVDLVVTVQDFQRSGWRDAVSTARQRGYRSMWSAFIAAANAAIENSEPSTGKVLWLLADACSPMLDPKSTNEPFSPMMVMEGKRSPLPSDLTGDDLAFLASIVDEIDEPRLQGRVADILWTCVTPRNPQHALTAMDAYRSIPIDTDSWVAGARECWTRAAVLAGLMGDGAGDRMREIADAARDACHATTTEDGYLGLWLSDLLTEHPLLKREEFVPLAEHLESLGDQFIEAGDLQRGRDYLRRAAELFGKRDEADRAADALVKLAEGWVKEAEIHKSGMVAASFYENAIQIFRSIPRARRTDRKVDERIAELRAKLGEAGERSLDEMGTMTTEGVDISDMVRSAREAVRSKSAVDALRAFTQISRFREEEARQHAIDGIKNFPISKLFPATFISRDGRVIAKSPGMDLDTTTIGGNDIGLRREMIQYHGIRIGIAVQGSIGPAFETLLLEHRLREADFVGVAHQSPIVPPDRAELFGKALYAGYDRDFVTAIHLLAPQVENMVRYHLKAAGATTTTLNQQGIETENGLSTLIDLAQMTEVFGPDTTFEIRSLFCDPFGPNLRNEVAHGLMVPEAGRSIFTVYAWWFCLRLVFIYFWNTHPRSSGSEGADDGK